MFISVVKSGRHAYVQLRESWRDETGKTRTRVVRSLGRLDDLVKDDPDALEKLKAQFSEKSRRAAARHRAQELRDRILSMDDGGTGETALPELGFGHYAVRAVWDRILCMGRVLRYRQKTAVDAPFLPFDVNDALLFLVAADVIAPVPSGRILRERAGLLGAPAKGLTEESLERTLQFTLAWKDELFAFVRKALERERTGSLARCQDNGGHPVLVLWSPAETRLAAPVAERARGGADTIGSSVSTDPVEELEEMVLRAHADGLLGDDCFDAAGNPRAEALPERLFDRVVIGMDQTAPVSSGTGCGGPLVALVVDGWGLPLDLAFLPRESDGDGAKRMLADLAGRHRVTCAVSTAGPGGVPPALLAAVREAGLGMVFPVRRSVAEGAGFDLSAVCAGGDAVLGRASFAVAGLGELGCVLVAGYDEGRAARDRALGERLRKAARRACVSSEVLPDGDGRRGWRCCAWVPPVTGTFPGADTVSSPYGMLVREVVRAHAVLCDVQGFLARGGAAGGLKALTLWEPGLAKGRALVLVLALAVSRVIRILLEKKGVSLSPSALGHCLAAARVVALPDDMDWGADVRFALCGLESGTDGDSNTALRSVFEAVGLKPVPRVSSLSEMADCLGTKFRNAGEAVPCLASLFPADGNEEDEEAVGDEENA